jgi:UDP-N-acetylmuramate: L-alanyl-gamma-D-glutamyl-meso-diaminopimelate ligase
VNLVPRSGRILFWGESPDLRRAVAKAFCAVETFGLSADCDWFAGDILWNDGATEFRVIHRGSEVATIRIPVVGRHNVLNALSAVALAHNRGVECEAIRRALASFQSVRRRMEIKGEPGGVLIVEDFAHHPTAIRLTLEAARTRWPGRKIWAAVEPRSNTMRRKIFEDVLPDALALADAVLLGPVSRAELLADDDRLSPESIADAIRRRGKPALNFASAADVASHLAAHAAPGDLVLVMSNGSFDGLCSRLLDRLQSLPGRRP